MLQPATGFYIWVSLGIFCTLAYLAECERCVSEEACKPVDFSAVALQNTYPSFLGSDNGHVCHQKHPDTENVCRCSELFSFPSTWHDPHSKEQCLRRENPGIYPSNSGPDLREQSSRCFMNIRWPGHETVPSSVNNTDVILFPGKGYLLYTRKAGPTSHNIEIEKSPSSELPSPCLGISPKKLDWGQNYIYHPSVAFLTLKNTCNESLINVYESFSTDSQFYLFNHSDVVLGPGEATSISFVFLPKSLGSSSAELVLRTSLGGYLVPAKGGVIESPLFPSFEAAGSCDESETTISLSVRNSASQSLKVVKVAEINGGNKLFKIKYMEGLLLFPGSVTQVALVTYDASDADYDSFVEMAHVSVCGIQVLTNDSNSPSLEIPCQNIFGICRRGQPELKPHLPGTDTRSYRTGSLSSMERSSVLTKTMGDSKMDEFVLKKWKDQSTMSGLYLLDDQELVFPLVPLDRYIAKSITVKNPSNQHVTVQLILNSGETVHNCKLHDRQIPSPWWSNHSTGPTRYGFSMVGNAVTEAFIHPYGTASLGPIFFHPSNRCEWTSSALVRNNLSGVEQLSLRGSGGVLSLVLLEGSEHKQKLHFNTPVEETSFGCRQPLLKKLFAHNSGEFNVTIERVDISGKACRLDGFSVHNCEGFALTPGQSLELEISYLTDFSRPMVQRDLEFKLADGMLVLPMQASMPVDMVNFCRKSIFWVQVKKYSIAMVLAAVLIFLFFWCIMLQMVPPDSMDYLIKGDKRSIPVVRPKKSGKVSKTGHHVNARQVDLKKGIITEHADVSFPPSLISKSIEIESSVKEAPPGSMTVRTRKDKRRRPRKRSGGTSGLMAHLEVSSSQSGNSTPSSPLSPVVPTTTPSPKYVKENTFNKEPVVGAVGMSGHSSGNPFYTHQQQQQQPFSPNSTGYRPTFSPSATFPGTGRSAVDPPSLYPSRLAISPHARAPGPKIKPQKAIEADERTNSEGRFTYDIWGNHFSGIHLMSRADGSLGMVSEYIKGHSGSFFVRDPQQTLLPALVPLTVSKSIEEG